MTLELAKDKARVGGDVEIGLVEEEERNIGSFVRPLTDADEEEDVEEEEEDGDMVEVCSVGWLRWIGPLEWMVGLSSMATLRADVPVVPAW